MRHSLTVSTFSAWDLCRLELCAGHWLETIRRVLEADDWIAILARDPGHEGNKRIEIVFEFQPVAKTGKSDLYRTASVNYRMTTQPRDESITLPSTGQATVPIIDGVKAADVTKLLSSKVDTLALAMFPGWKTSVHDRGPNKVECWLRPRRP